MTEDIKREEFVKNLILDKGNPRLVEFGISSKSTEQEIMMILYNEMAVTELMYSIVKNGFWPYEPIIIMKAPEKQKFIVLEGNRRLTALRLLLGIELPDEFEMPESIAKLIQPDTKSKIEKIPVLEVDSRYKAWKYIGFKHVNGPAKWGSIAKAKYVANVHENFNVPLKDISLQLGDTNSTVQKLYQGVKILEQADVSGAFKLSEVIGSRIYFSHLYTGIQRRGIREFIGLNDAEKESKEPVPNNKIKELGQLLEWLFGRKSEKKLSLITSQNPDLKYLDEVLQSKEATRALKDGESLSFAYELTKPADTLFEDYILDTKRSILKAKSLVNAGFQGEESLVRIAGQIAETADSLYSEMYSKLESTKGTKRLT
jgi:hypothetical protein